MDYNVFKVTIHCWNNNLEIPTKHTVILQTYAQDCEQFSPSEWDYLTLLVNTKLDQGEEICDAIDPDIQFIAKGNKIDF